MFAAQGLRAARESSEVRSLSGICSARAARAGEPVRECSAQCAATPKTLGETSLPRIQTTECGSHGRPALVQALPRAVRPEKLTILCELASCRTLGSHPANHTTPREPRKTPNRRRMILTTCAACAAPLAHDAPRCVRCKVRYCDYCFVGSESPEPRAARARVSAPRQGPLVKVSTS